MEGELNYLSVLISEAECEIHDLEQYLEDNPDEGETLDEIKYWEKVKKLLNNILAALTINELNKKIRKMSELKLTGKIVAIMDVQVLKNDFSKREFVIETDDQYPQMVKLEFTQAKCSVLDTEKVGNQVTVSFNVRGNKWKNKEGKDVYFVSLNAWRIEAAAAAPDSTPFADAEPPVEDLGDGLPF